MSGPKFLEWKKIKEKNPQVNPQRCRGLFEKKKPENFPKNIEMAQKWFQGVFTPAEHEFTNDKIYTMYN